MFSLRKLNIRNKLMAIIMLVSSTGVCLAGCIFISSSVYTQRENLKNELISLAGVIGNNCKVILEFNFPEDAGKVLSSLEARHSIVFAGIYNADDEVLSTYGRSTAGEIAPTPDTEEDSQIFANGCLHVFHYVLLNEKVIGAIYLQDNMSEITKHIIRDVFVLILTVIITLIATYILSSRLQRIISGPILSLADIAGNVSEKKDYSIRANKESEDEVGTLIDSFNDMLVEIEKRDSSIRQSEERFRTLMEQAADAFFLHDMQGRILEVNQCACDSLGYTRDELLEMSVLDIEARYVTLEQLKPLWDSLAPKKPVTIEGEHKRKDGKLFPVEVRLGLLETKGQQEVLALVRDITERKLAEEELTQHREHLEDKVTERTLELAVAIEAAEKARQSSDTANRAKSEFLANMSHELRTPLNAILGFSQIMDRDPDLTLNQKESLTTITRSGEHLLDLINDVLEISKIEAGRVMMDETEFDLTLMLDALRSMFYFRTSEKHIALNFECNPDVPRYIRTDARRLRQVLMNLLSNAVKFTMQGSVTLRCSCQSSVISDQIGTETEKRGNGEEAERPDDGRQMTDSSGQPQQTTDDGQRTLQFEIEDTGPGIEAEEMDELFEPFRQTKSGKGAQEGTGLGLPISRKFVHLMGGDISVSSKVGHSSIFSFNIPVSKTKATEIQQPSPERRVIGLEQHQRIFRILVVDDVEDNRKLVIRLLEVVGFEIKEAKDGRDAVEEWEVWEPHLIFMDMAMPVMDGYEATRHIRAEETEPSSSSLDSEEENQFKIKHSTLKIKRVPIIALTAVAFEDEREKMLASGCDDVVHKPLREKDIFDVMAKHLGISYIYEDQQARDGACPKKKAADTLTSVVLTELPESLLAELKQATLDLDMNLIQIIIDQIRDINTTAADAFETLAKDFQYDMISDILEEV